MFPSYCQCTDRLSPSFEGLGNIWQNSNCFYRLWFSRHQQRNRWISRQNNLHTPPISYLGTYWSKPWNRAQLRVNFCMWWLQVRWHYSWLETRRRHFRTCWWIYRKSTAHKRQLTALCCFLSQITFGWHRICLCYSRASSSSRNPPGSCEWRIWPYLFCSCIWISLCFYHKTFDIRHRLRK